VAIQQNPLGIAVNPKKPQVYVACRNSLGNAAYVSIIDSSDTNYVVNNVSVGSSIASPNEVAISPLGDKAYVTLGPSGRIDHVSVIDTAKGAVDTSVPLITVGKEPGGIAVNPNGNTVNVANKLDSTVSVINTTQIDPTTNTYKVIQTINSVNSASGFPVSFGQFIGNYPITTPIQNPTTNNPSQTPIKNPNINNPSQISRQTPDPNTPNQISRQTLNSTIHSSMPDAPFYQNPLF